MATTVPAEIASLSQKVGLIAPGYAADLVVLKGYGKTPARALIDAQPSDVMLTVVAGQAMYGEPSMLGTLGVTGFDPVSVCGESRGLLVRDATVASGGSETLADLTNLLTTDTGAAPFRSAASAQPSDIAPMRNSMTTDLRRFFLLLLALAFAAGGPDAYATVESPDEEQFSVDDELTAAVTDDDLNGLWIATVNGTVLPKDAVIESWTAVGIRLTLDGKSYQLTRSADALSGAGVALTVNAVASGVYDDTVTGTVDGATVSMRRDSYVKAPITLTFPGDRPFRQYLLEVIAPAAQQDRESFVIMHSYKMGDWLKTCELYKHGSWQRKYFKGATYAEQTASFFNVVNAVDLQKVNPRRMTKNYKFSQALQANLADPNLMGLAMSTFSMYFTTAAGRRCACRSPATRWRTSSPIARCARSASAWWRWPLRATGRSPAPSAGSCSTWATCPRATATVRADGDGADGEVRREERGRALGRGPLGDHRLVRGDGDRGLPRRRVRHPDPRLGLQHDQRAVLRPRRAGARAARQVDSAGKPVIGQVIVGSQLRPGDPSYADVLNNGNDMQEYSDMAQLKTLTTPYLRLKHPELIAAVESAFARRADDRARLAGAQTTSSTSSARSSTTQGPPGRAQGRRGRPGGRSSVVALFDTLNAESAQLEAYLLARDLKSNVAAPKSTGFLRIRRTAVAVAVAVNDQSTSTFAQG